MKYIKNRFCKKAGCSAFAESDGYCREHRYMSVRKSHTAHCPEAYDSIWTKTRNAYAEEHPLCEDCLKKGETVPMREVHHIIPIEFGGDRLDRNNLVSLCSACHHRRHIYIQSQTVIENQLRQENKK